MHASVAADLGLLCPPCDEHICHVKILVPLKQRISVINLHTVVELHKIVYISFPLDCDSCIH